MRGYFRIGISIVFGVVLIGGALLFRDHFVSAGTERPNDISTLVASRMLRVYQDTKDSNGNGVQDWLEELQGLDPNAANPVGSSTPGTTTTPVFEAKTLTQKFSVEFFDAFMRAHKAGKRLTPEEQQALVDSAARKFAAENTTKLLTRSDITISNDSSDVAIRAYADAVGTVVAHDSPKKALENEAVIMKRAVESNDPKALADITTIKESYEHIVADIQKIPVPTILVNEHLNLLNSFTAVRDDIEGMEKVFEDPMLSYIRLKRYPDDASGIANSVNGVRTVLETKSLVFDSHDMGSFFFSLRP